jgi:hypothetical protein
MRNVRIALARTDTAAVRVWGEVKALDLPGSPTIAHAEAAVDRADLFAAMPGRHSFHFRVSEPAMITLTAEVDGRVVGPALEFDATQITAGRRYHFEVPS